MATTASSRWTLIIAALIFAAAGGVVLYRFARPEVVPKADVVATVPAPTYAGKLSYLALGDSYTSGEQVELPERWPDQLATIVRTAGLDLSDPQIIAQEGWTTDDLLSNFDKANPHHHYDLVTIQIGANNQFHELPTADYRRQFAKLLQRSIAAANGQASHVLAITIPDWSVTPFAANRNPAVLAKHIDEFNRIMQAECAKLHVTCVDITALTREAATQPALVALDGLHPSADQLRNWANFLAPTVEQALREPAPPNPTP